MWFNCLRALVTLVINNKPEGQTADDLLSMLGVVVSTDLLPPHLSSVIPQVITSGTKVNM